MRKWYCIALFVLITTCGILNFVFELTICLLYHLQLHTRACAASQWLHAQCSSNTVDTIFACIQMWMFRKCVILHAQIIYSLVVVWRECNFLYVKALWCHFLSGDVTSGLMTSHPWQINTTWLWTVWGSHVSTIKWGSLTYACPN